MAVPNWKLPFIIESSGAVIVGEESCIGTRNTRDLVEESGDTLEELLDALVDRYMRIDCACFTPNQERLDHIVDMARDLKVKGVIHYGLSFCQPYAIEAFKVGKALEEAQHPHAHHRNRLQHGGRGAAQDPGGSLSGNGQITIKKGGNTIVFLKTFSPQSRQGRREIYFS